LAQADGAQQASVVGRQTADRVGFFLRVENFALTHERMVAAGVEFITAPREEPYGMVVVFRDVVGNRCGPIPE
jgi:predicted enzyme related to lactoylglutathione lyase